MTTNKGIIQYGGNIEATTIAVGDLATAISNAKEIQKLASDMPEEKRESLECIERLADHIQAELAKEKPNRTWLQVTASGLAEAAKTVADVAPNVLKTALSVVEALTK